MTAVYVTISAQLFLETPPVSSVTVARYSFLWSLPEVFQRRRALYERLRLSGP